MLHKFAYFLKATLKLVPIEVNPILIYSMDLWFLEIL